MIEKLKLDPKAIAADKGEIFEALTQLANTLMELNGAILQQVVTMCRQVSDDGAEFEAVLKMQRTGLVPAVPAALLAVSARSLASHAAMVHEAVLALVGADAKPGKAGAPITLSRTASSLQAVCDLLQHWDERALHAQFAYMASVAAGNLFIAHQAGESIRAMGVTARHFARDHSSSGTDT
jgi:hypothetical protein